MTYESSGSALTHKDALAELQKAKNATPEKLRHLYYAKTSTKGKDWKWFWKLRKVS